MIKVLINEKEVDILEQDVVRITLSANNFANIETRNSAYTNNFKLPLTAKNRAIFESSEILINSTNIPYEQLVCRITDDGIDVINGKAQLVSCSNFYEVKVFGTNYDFFSSIKNKLLSQLDLSEYDHVWNLTNVAASRTNDSGYIYPIIDYHSDSPNSYMTDASRGFDARYLFTTTFFHSIISKIIEEESLIPDGDIFNDKNYLKLLLPFSNERFISDYNQEEDFNAIVDNEMIVPTGIATIIEFDNDSVDGGFDNGGNFSAFTTYTVPYNMYVSFYCKVIVLSANPSTIELSITVDGVSKAVSSTTLTELVIKEIELTTPKLLLLAGQEVKVFGFAIGDPVGITFGSIFKSNVYADIALGNTISVARTLPNDMTCGTLFKWFLQMFNGVCVVKNGVCYVKTLDEIIDNKGSAVDWSNKLDESEDEEITFQLDNYTNKNILKYKDDKNVIKPLGSDYDLLVNNDNLKSVSNLITSPFSASEMVIRLIGENVPQIKIIKEGVFSDRVEPRILILNRISLTTNVTYTDGVSQVITNTNLPFCYFILPSLDFNLGFTDNLILLYGTGLVSMMDKIKILKKIIRLNSFDINQIDFFKPVWINKYSCYFFISEITQYNPSNTDSTFVELVKLP